MVIEVRVIGLNNWAKTLRVLIKNIPTEHNKFVEKDLEYLKKEMIKKTRPYKFSSGRGISVTDSFEIIPLSKNEKSSNYKLTNIAPHAAVLEHGTIGHYVSREKYNKVDEWMTAHDIKHNFLYVGGQNSSIKKGNSDREFFATTINEYLQSGKAKNNFGEALKKAVKKSIKK